MFKISKFVARHSYWYRDLTPKQILKDLSVKEIVGIIIFAVLSAWFMVYAVPAIITILPGGK